MSTCYAHTQVNSCEHPRLLMTEETVSILQTKLSSSSENSLIYSYILNECDNLLQAPVLTYKKSGFRLLPVSREAFRRIFYLSFSYKMTKNLDYADRAIKEMDAVCAFPDWNPGHFLDVGEMATAVAIGYDWLYDRLDENKRELITKALMDKALLPSMDPRYNDFLTRINNWNQVCNCGMTYAALSIYETNPSFCSKIIQRALQTVNKSMKSYAPDGAYPEGYQYWGYGTTMNVMMIAGLETALSSSNDIVRKKSFIRKNRKLTSLPGFMQTAYYMLYMVGPSGLPFNYSDSKAETQFFPVQYWFARKCQDSSLLWNEKSYLSEKGANFTAEEARFVPLALIFQAEESIVEPKGHFWVGRGKQPMFFVRTDWRPKKGVYLAAKGGSPRTDHGHMDAGSFVFETDGIRWTEDLGVQSYDSLEKAGIRLWDSFQTGDRWKIFRYSNFVHNTISVNGQLHNAESKVPLVEILDSSSNMGGSFDMTSLYPDKFANATRTLTIVDGKFLSVNDSVCSKEDIDYQSTIVTSAEVSAFKAEGNVSEDESYLFKKDGKKLLMTIKAPKGYEIEVLENKPPHSYDEPNLGTKRLVIHFPIKKKELIDIEINLLPID